MKLIISDIYSNIDQFSWIDNEIKIDCHNNNIYMYNCSSIININQQIYY